MAVTNRGAPRGLTKKDAMMEAHGTVAALIDSYLEADGSYELNNRIKTEKDLERHRQALELLRDQHKSKSRSDTNYFNREKDIR